MRIFVSVSALLNVLVATSALAGLQNLPSPVDASSGIAIWNQDFAQTTAKLRSSGTLDKVTGYTECREVREIRGAYLCQSEDQVQMNEALGRTSFFVEGLMGNPRGNVPSVKDPSVRRARTMIGGHDLKGKDLMDFHREATKKCATAPEYCLNPNEEEFYTTFVLPRAAVSEDFVVITYARKSTMPYTTVVTHEIMHAQFFLEPAYAQVAEEFWKNEVTAADRARVVSILGQYYDGTSDFLMMNEFQAYILMANAETDLLMDFVATYRDRLMQALAAKGVRPIQVQ